MKAIRLLIVLVLPAVVACSYQFPEEDEKLLSDLGSIDVQKVIAVGDDFLAGVMDGALYHSGQQNSIPAVIARQMNEIVPLQFSQPTILSETGYNLYKSTEGNVYGKWIYSFENHSSQFPNKILTPGEHPDNYGGNRDEIGNYALPGLLVETAFLPQLTDNPYYQRIIPQSGSSGWFSDVRRSNPTFVVLWLGMNDYLGYAMNGAADENGPSHPGWYSDVKMTSADGFRQNFKVLVDELVQNSDCKLVVGNLLSITSFPFFYHRPYNKLFLENSALSSARAGYRKFNEAVAVHNRNASAENQRPFIDFFDNGWNLHPQPVVVVDNALADASYPDGRPLPKYRQLTKNELVLLEVTDSMIATGYGSVVPLAEKHYLSENDIMEIESRVAEFNTVINEAVGRYPGRIVLADVASKVDEIARASRTDAWGEPVNNTTWYVNGVPVDGSLGVNSIFSLDGIHFNQRGNAFVANAFIRAINAGYNANIPPADINRWPGNTYKASF